MAFDEVFAGVPLEDEQYHEMYRSLVLHEGAWGEHPESLALVGDDVDRVLGSLSGDLSKDVVSMVALFGRLVKYLCGDGLEGVSIGLDAKQSCVDLTTLHISLSLEELTAKLPYVECVKAFFGHFIHEVGHMLFTRPGIIEKFNGVPGVVNSVRGTVDSMHLSGLVWSLCNSMEDRRVETLMLRKYPGYKSYLEAARKLNVLHAWSFGKDKMDLTHGDFDATKELPETLFSAYALHRVMLRSSLDDYEFLLRVRAALGGMLRGYSIDDVDLVLDEHYESYGDCFDAAMLLDSMLRGDSEGCSSEDSDGSEGESGDSPDDSQSSSQEGSSDGPQAGSEGGFRGGTSGSTDSGGDCSTSDSDVGEGNYIDMSKFLPSHLDTQGRERGYEFATCMRDIADRSLSLKDVSKSSGYDSLVARVKDGIKEYFGVEGDIVSPELISLSRDKDLMSSGDILDGVDFSDCEEGTEQRVEEWRRDLRVCDLAYSVPVMGSLSSRGRVRLSDRSRLIADVLRRRYRAFSTVVTSTREFYELDEGDLDEDEVHMSGYSQDVFCDTQEVSGGCLLEVIALLDLSGSMGDAKMSLLRELTAGLGVAFSDNPGVLFSAYGHTTLSSSASPTGESLLIYPVCEKGHKIDLGVVSALRSELNNVDGYAIRWVAGKFDRLSRHRLLLIISDGAPYGVSYGGDMGVVHTRTVVEQVRAEGISVLSVSLDSFFSDSQSEMYGDMDVVSWTTPREVSEALVHWISKRFERGVLEFQEEVCG